MKGIKHIFFDLDNTLWDHRGNSENTLKKMFAEQKIEDKYKLSFDEWHDYFYDLNEELWALLRDAKIDKDELRQRRFSEAFINFNINDSTLHNYFEDTFMERMSFETSVVLGAKEILDYLYPKYNLHVLTNGFEEVSSKKINNSVLNGYFQTITTADELQLRKPNKKIFAHALGKANAKVSESAMVGDDWIADCIGAANMNMVSVFFNSLNEDHQHPDVIEIKKLIDLKKLF